MENYLIYHQQGRDGFYKTWHEASQHTLLFVHGGQGSLVMSDESLPLSSGALCFIGKGRQHYTFPEDPDAYERSKIFVGDALLSRIISLMPADSDSEAFREGRARGVILSPAAIAEAETVFMQLQNAQRSTLFEQRLVCAILRLIILLKENENKAAPRRKEGFVERAIGYINSHITDEICIDDICGAIYASKYHFCREFKRKTGFTVMQYVLKNRIALAKELLCSSTGSISEISERCGFSGLSYFSRSFKAEVGLTPLQFRRK